MTRSASTDGRMICSGCGDVLSGFGALGNHAKYSKTCTPAARFWGKPRLEGCPMTKPPFTPTRESDGSSATVERLKLIEREVEDTANEMDQLFRQRHKHEDVTHLLMRLVNRTAVSENRTPAVDIHKVRATAFEEAAARIAIGADGINGGRVSLLVRDILHDIAKQIKAMGEEA